MEELKINNGNLQINDPSCSTALKEPDD